MQASLFIAVIILLRALAGQRLSTRAFVMLWVFAALRFLFPFSIPSPFSIYRLTEPFRLLNENAVVFTPVANNLRVVHYTGAGIIAVYMLIMHWRGRHVYKSALPVDNTPVNAWKQAHPLFRRYVVKQSDRIISPFTSGVIFPVIYLPKQVAETGGTRLDYVLTHEFTHIKYLDILTQWLLAVVLCVGWYNPLIWVMYILAGRDLERACDEKVLTCYTDTERASYALTLLDMEEKRAVIPLFSRYFARTAVEERIRSIIKMKRHSVWTVLISFLFVFGITAVFTTTVPYVPEPIMFVSVISEDEIFISTSITGVTVATENQPSDIQSSDIQSSDIQTTFTVFRNDINKEVFHETPVSDLDGITITVSNNNHILRK